MRARNAPAANAQRDGIIYQRAVDNIPM